MMDCRIEPGNDNVQNNSAPAMNRGAA